MPWTACPSQTNPCFLLQTQRAQRETKPLIQKRIKKQVNSIKKKTGAKLTLAMVPLQLLHNFQLSPVQYSKLLRQGLA